MRRYLARIVNVYRKIIPLRLRKQITLGLLHAVCAPLMRLYGNSLRTANYVMYLDPFDGKGLFSFAHYHVYRTVVFEPYEIDLWLRSIEATGGCTAVDIGANYGLYTLEACAVGYASKLERVIALEPHDKVFSCLKRSIEASGFTEKVILLKVVCMDQHGEEYDYFANASESSLSRVGKASDESVFTPTKVRGVTLDGVLSELAIPKSGKFIIKMDIEGNEPVALRGMKETLSTAEGYQIYFEFCPIWMRECGNDPLEFASNLLAMNNDMVAEIIEGERRLKSIEGIESFKKIIDRCSRSNDEANTTNIFVCRNLGPPNAVLCSSDGLQCA